MASRNEVKQIRVCSERNGKVKVIYLNNTFFYRVIGKRSVNSVLNEKYLLEHLRHPYIVNMHYAFQDRENLYLVLDLLRGGDLRYHLGKMRRFNEE